MGFVTQQLILFQTSTTEAPRSDDSRPWLTDYACQRATPRKHMNTKFTVRFTWLTDYASQRATPHKHMNTKFTVRFTWLTDYASQRATPRKLKPSSAWCIIYNTYRFFGAMTRILALMLS